jgi:hypothetical protein
MRHPSFCSLSLWERARVRAAAFNIAARLLPPSALTPTLSQREREQVHCSAEGVE